jgi:hypothetical protein
VFEGAVEFLLVLENQITCLSRLFHHEKLVNSLEIYSSVFMKNLVVWSFPSGENHMTSSSGFLTMKNI